MRTIGGADGPTAVFVSFSGDIWWLLLLIVFVIFILRTRKKK